MVFSSITGFTKNVGHKLYDLTVPKNPITFAISSGAGWFAPSVCKTYLPALIVARARFAAENSFEWSAFRFLARETAGVTAIVTAPGWVDQMAPYITIVASISTSIALNALSYLVFGDEKSEEKAKDEAKVKAVVVRTEQVNDKASAPSLTPVPA